MGHGTPEELSPHLWQGSRKLWSLHGLGLSAEAIVTMDTDLQDTDPQETRGKLPLSHSGCLGRGQCSWSLSKVGQGGGHALEGCG